MRLLQTEMVSILSATIIAKQQKPLSLLYKAGMSVLTVKVIKTDNHQKKKDRPTNNAISAGVIIDKSGLILTTAKVVTKAAAIGVQFNDGQFLEAVLVQSIPEANMALLRLKQIPKQLPVAKMGDDDELRIGQQMMIIDNSGTYSEMPCAAIITGKMMRGTHTSNELVGFIQLERSILADHKDGILFNKKGELLGIIYANLISGDNGKMVIAIAINTVKEMADYTFIGNRANKADTES